MPVQETQIPVPMLQFGIPDLSLPAPQRPLRHHLSAAAGTDEVEDVVGFAQLAGTGPRKHLVEFRRFVFRHRHAQDGPLSHQPFEQGEWQVDYLTFVADHRNRRVSHVDDAPWCAIPGDGRTSLDK